MSFLGGLLSICFTGIQCDKPLDYGMIPMVAVQEKAEENIETPFLEGKGTRYDYKLGGKWWSKNHSTCALRIKERYKTYKVCSKATGKCVNCYHNDRGPSRQDRVIDLSSHAFKELGVPLSRGVTEVLVYEIK